MKVDGEVWPGRQDVWIAASLPLGHLFSPQVGALLKSRDVEDIVIYLSSLGKHNSITTDSLTSTYKQWSLAQQKSTLATAAECMYLSSQPLPRASTSPSWEPAGWRQLWLTSRMSSPALADLGQGQASPWNFQAQRSTTE